jgi:hypothetical protein
MSFIHLIIMLIAFKAKKEKKCLLHLTIIRILNKEIDIHLINYSYVTNA